MDINNLQPGDLIENITLEQLKTLDENSMSVFYELVNGKSFARVYPIVNPPSNAIEYHDKVNRLARMNVESLGESEITTEHRKLREWFKELHPQKFDFEL